tara:strand:+ start:472 stop:2550 length:2079 start_codon:yes stop_codon:yes gene_type:complete
MKLILITLFSFTIFFKLSSKENWSISKLNHESSAPVLVIEDQSDTLNASNVLNQYIHWFNGKIKLDEPTVSFTTSTFWQVVKVDNNTESTKDLLLQVGRPLTNIVELYQFNSEYQLINTFKSGDDFTFTKRPIINHNFLFPISLSPSQSQYLVTKMKSDGEVLSLDMKLWDTDSFLSHVSKEQLFQGFYYGLLIFVTSFFLFVGIALRQKIYLYFVVYVSLLFFMQFSIDGLSYRYLWPENPWIANRAIVFFATASVIFLLIYVRAFLRIRELANRSFDLLFTGYLVVLGICLMMSLLPQEIYYYSFVLVNLLAFFSSFLFLAGIYLRYKKTEELDLLFTSAFISVLIGGVAFILVNVGLFQSDFLEQNAIKIGSGVEIAFLSMALAGRYRTTQVEKEAAQQEAYIRLEEITQIKEDQNTILEKQVNERTKEVVSKNDELSKKNKEIIDSINYAERLENSILPSKSRLFSNFLDGFVLYLPKDIVSGDFYYREETKTHIIIAVADCTGHGVPGAMLSIVGHNALNRCINELGLSDANLILDQLSKLVEELFNKGDNQIEDGMDISLISIDKKTKKATFSGAHNGLYLIRDNDLQEFKGTKQPIGKYSYRTDFEVNKFHLKSNDFIFMTTDGFPDQFGGPMDKKYKIKNLKELITSNQSKSCIEIEEILTQEFHSWKGNQDQIDDVCIMGIRI